MVGRECKRIVLSESRERERDMEGQVTKPCPTLKDMDQSMGYGLFICPESNNLGLQRGELRQMLHHYNIKRNTSR